MATEKQINYILSLAKKRGISTDYMNGSWNGLATMRQRHGRVRDFLAGLDKDEASKIIDKLK